MLNATTYKDVVSGRRRGISASLLRGALRIAETPYRLAVRRRNLRFDAGRAEIFRVGVPVVSVGNLTLGGTGKTPAVAWIVRWFLDRGIRAGIVSRGYGAADGAPNDEARELAARLPDVPHVQNRDRVAAAREAIERCGCRAIVIDDGFQHRRLARDLDIVLLDATEPFGYDHVFPRGTLREPIEALRRAHAAMLTRTDLVSPERREEIRRRALSVAPQLDLIEATHAPRELVNAVGERRELDWLAGRRIAAFCGIGNPAAFERTLRGCGANVVAFRALADHFDYTQQDNAGRSTAAEIGRWAMSAGAEALVATCKDLVKLPFTVLDSVPLWALAISLEITANRELLERRLAALALSSTSDLRPPTPAP